MSAAEFGDSATGRNGRSAVAGAKGPGDAGWRQWIYRRTRRLNFLDVTTLYRVDADAAGHPLPDEAAGQVTRLAGDQLAELVNDVSVPDDLGAPGDLGALGDADRSDRSVWVDLQDDRVQAFAWLLRGEITAEENFSRCPRLGVAARCPDNAAMAINVWTNPAGRGRGLARRLLTEAMRQESIAVLYASVDWTNASSRRMFERMGGVSVASVWCWGKGQRRVVWTGRAEPRDRAVLS